MHNNFNHVILQIERYIIEKTGDFIRSHYLVNPQKACFLPIRGSFRYDTGKQKERESR